jgi:hypothetical protein
MKRLIILFLFILSTVAFSQEDSLHLVFTFTGTNTGNAIYACGSLGDINHDGFDDFVIRRVNVNYCEIYFGGKNPDFSKPMKLYDQPNADMGVLFNIGDINGDKFDDFGQSGFYNNDGWPTGIIYVFYGSTNFVTIPDWSLMSNCIDGLLGASASGGDINGNGIDDLIIGEPYNWCDGIGRAYLFYGGDTLSNNPDVTFESGTSEDFFGGNLCMNGDINGDGFNDLIISAPDQNGDPNLISKIYIYFGKSNISIRPDLIINSSFNYLPLRPFYLPDFNGDGFTDFFITAENKLYFGSSDFSGNDTLKFISNELYDNFGETAGYAGDINNDGYSDLILSATGHKNANCVMVGGAYIYLGSSNSDTTADYFLEGEKKWSTFGFNCGTLGDINGDGYDEFYIIAPQYPDTAGTGNELGKIYVYSMKKFLVGIDENDEQIPQKYYLEQNYPNPFNPTTTINYSIPSVIARSGATRQSTDLLVQLKVYDILGREVATLVNKEQAPGNYSVKFDASKLPSGIYFYRLECGNFSSTKKMLLLK